MKRLLVLSYYFPPSGGPGVQRILKFVKYLPEFGWEPTVVTVRPENAAYPNIDRSLEQEIPRDIDVHRTYAWDPYSMYARLLGKRKEETIGVGFIGENKADRRYAVGKWLRANVFLPDARVGWTPFATSRARQLMRQSHFDAIFSTGPPHSTHIAALRLSRSTNLPWLADFRDPWTEIDFYDELPMTRLSKRIDRALEDKVLRDVDGLTVVGPSMKRMFKDRTSARIETIYNGFDEEDFSVVPSAISRDAFEITHVGNMNATRSPAALWKALGSLKQAGEMQDVRVRMVGNVDPTVLADVRRAGLDDVVRIEPYKPHAEAIQVMQSAAVLLLSINRVAGAENILTGKLFEYLATEAAILGVGPPNGDASEIVRETAAGNVFDYEDVEGIMAFLRRAHDAWLAGSPLRSDGGVHPSRFSRRNQTSALADVLTRLDSSQTSEVT